VWKAVHIKTGTVTAIKRVPVENDLDEILNEIKIMKQCRSPYIISYYGSYFKDNELWIVSELGIIVTN
jgi:serine/threonine protein kinase